MKGIGRVIAWEVGRHLRNKQFLIGIFLMPVIFAAFGGIPALIEYLDTPRQEVYGVVDQIDALPIIEAQLEGTEVQVVPGNDTESLAQAVADGELDGYFVVDPSFIATGHIQVIADRPTMVNRQLLTQALSAVVRQYRLAEAEIGIEQLAYVTAPAQVEAVSLSSVAAADENAANEEDAKQAARMVMAIAFAGALLILIISSGSMLLQSALQEKRDRMIEVVLSSIGPDTLMFGKIIGHFILGVIQLGFWAAVGLPIAYFLFDIPIGDFIDVSLLPTFLFFTMLGYLFFAAIFVGIGATMEDIQSAGNSQGMVFMLPVLSFVVIGPITSNPDGLIAQIATLFPITSPTVAIFRMGFTEVPTWELLAAGALLLASTFIVVKLAAKLFRVGMLMYGKTASISEMMKWLRQA